MNSPPPDIEPDELAFYELFGELRRELQDLVVELAEVVFTRIELYGDADERTQNPDLTEVVSSALSQFVNLLTSWRGDGQLVDKADDDKPLNPPDDPTEP